MFFDTFFETIFGGGVVGFSLGKVGLGDVVAWVVVGVMILEIHPSLNLPTDLPEVPLRGNRDFSG